MLLCLMGGGEVPHPVLTGGGTPSQVKGYPIHAWPGGYPIPGQGWGGYPIQSWPGGYLIQSWPGGGGTPSQVQVGGVPHPVLAGGTPYSASSGVSGTGYPPGPGTGSPHPDLRWGIPPSAGWGTPHPDLGWGTPHQLDGVPPWTWDGVPPSLQTWDGVPPPHRGVD